MRFSVLSVFQVSRSTLRLGKAPESREVLTPCPFDGVVVWRLHCPGKRKDRHAGSCVALSMRLRPIRASIIPPCSIQALRRGGRVTAPAVHRTNAYPGCCPRAG
jgi:hypothetical protein